MEKAVALEESLKIATDSKLTYYQRYNLYWKGQILANMKALDKAQAAAAEFKTQALAYFRAGNMDKAKEVFEKIQALTSGRYYFGSSYVKSYFMLGQIYEQKGDKIKAADLYRKFLELWKDADPGLPEIDEAKAKLKALTEI